MLQLKEIKSHIYIRSRCSTPREIESQIYIPDFELFGWIDRSIQYGCLHGVCCMHDIENKLTFDVQE